MPELTRSQVRKLDRLLDLIENPEKFGCSFDKGDPETYQERAGKIVDDAVGVVDDLLDPLSPAERGKAELRARFVRKPDAPEGQ